MNIDPKLNLEVALGTMGLLNSNDEYIMQKLFRHIVFNAGAISEFCDIHHELLTLAEFYRGYSEPNLATSKKLWKESQELFSLMQNDSHSFLPLQELWLIKPILYIEATGPPATCLGYVTYCYSISSPLS